MKKKDRESDIESNIKSERISSKTKSLPVVYINNPESRNYEYKTNQPHGMSFHTPNRTCPNNYNENEINAFSHKTICRRKKSICDLEDARYDNDYTQKYIPNFLEERPQYCVYNTEVPKRRINFDENYFDRSLILTAPQYNFPRHSKKIVSRLNENYY